MLLMSYHRDGDIFEDPAALRDIASMTAGLILHEGFPSTCHVLDVTSKVCAAPLTLLSLQYDTETIPLPASAVTLGVDPSSAGPPTGTPPLRLAPEMAPTQITSSMNTSAVRMALFRYAAPQLAADRGLIT